ncbi:MAG: hypothetical protein WAO52_08025 [Prolixibacteraceae bacterium]
MKKISLILLILILVISCSKDDAVEDKTRELINPIEELAWLKEIKNSMSKCNPERSIIQARYNDQTVFYTAITDPLFDGIQTVTVFDCEGVIFRNLSAPEYLEFIGKSSEIKVLYRCKVQN